MPAISVSATRSAGRFWPNGRAPQRLFWLGSVVALLGATVLVLAARTQWLKIDHGYSLAVDSSSLMFTCGGLALLIGGVTAALPAPRRKVGEWLLIGVAALTVALAANIGITPDQPKEVSATVATQDARARPQRVHRALSLLAAQQNPAHNPTAKIVMLLLLSGAIGLIRWSAPAREQLDANRDARSAALDTASMGRLLGLEIQLGLLLLVIRQLNLVSPVFDHQIGPLIFFGFLVHYVFPLQYRLPFFLFLSLSGIVGVFGFVQAGWLIGIGLALIGLCHLPVSFRLRVVLLLLVGIGLGELRAGWDRPPWGEAIWPILASMFMFRLIVYLYSLKHRKAPVSFWSSLSYFFLLPNVVFPLFPVVDYATFQRTYYDADRHLIHQRGLKWIFWGVIHLLLYRAVYYYLVIGPDEVNSVANLVRYLVSNFLLILKLSGQFHFIVGVLLLFGFDLPRIMNRYWHADSFSDFWRRANIYWRDFMQRVVFYPIYFRLRHWPATASLLLATAVVFLVTWALHGYQWFWLRGSYSLSGPDVVFWTLFGVLVAANTVYDAKVAARKKASARRERSVGQIALHTLRIMGVFCVICVLWSIWISTSLAEWASLWTVAGPTWQDAKVLLPALLGGIALAAWGALTAGKDELADAAATGTGAGADKSFLATALSIVVAALALLLISHPAVYGQFGPKLSAVISELTKEKLSRQDLALLERAYYENLTRIERFNSQLWEKYNKGATNQQDEARVELQQHADWRANYIETGDFLGVLLRPSIGATGAPFYTNRWAMRDKDYELKPPPRTCRIALVGGSPEMNREVSNDKLWEAVLEDRLNRENDHKTVERFEILNFAAATHTALQRLAMFETKALPFEPDILFYIAHPSDGMKAISRLAQVVAMGTPIPYDDLRELVNKAGVKDDMSLRTIRSRLQPFSAEILACTYRRAAALCREHSIVPVFIYVPTLRELGEEETADHLRLAAEAGFNVVNLTGVFDNVDKQSLHRNEWDFHPNTRGHQIIADYIYEAVQKNPALIQKIR